MRIVADILDGVGRVLIVGFSDNNEALQFLETVKEKVNKPASQDAYVYASVETARIKLLLKDYEGARSALDEAEKILERFDSVDNVVHASFYRVNADYYLVRAELPMIPPTCTNIRQVKHEFTDYYRNALLYLACINDSQLGESERQQRAYSLSVAALLSKDIYNFGELLLHPILDSLKDTPHSWLRDLLFAFNAGDLRGFYSLKNNLSKDALFAQQENFLKEKICLSALTEAVSRRPPQERFLHFDTIVNETGVSLDEVEYLLMRALSLGLIRGTIDQVTQVVRVTWVQPKVLDRNQIENMRLRLQDWNAHVKKLGGFVEQNLEMGTVF